MITIYVENFSVGSTSPVAHRLPAFPLITVEQLIGPFLEIEQSISRDMRSYDPQFLRRPLSVVAKNAVRRAWSERLKQEWRPPNDDDWEPAIVEVVNATEEEHERIIEAVIHSWNPTFRTSRLRYL